MKKILLIMILGMFFVSCVSATDYMGKQYEDINIIEICTYDGFPCEDTFGCNITIIDPDNNLIVLNEVMTQNETTYNYTFILTDVLGDYAVKFYCSNVTFSGSNIESTLSITTTGREVNLTLIIGILIITLTLFLIAILVKNHALGFLSGILCLVSGVYIMVYGFGDVADMYTRAIAGTIIAFGGLVTMIAGYEWLDEID